LAHPLFPHRNNQTSPFPMVTPLKSEKEILIPPKKQLLGRKEKENPNPLLLKAISKKREKLNTQPISSFLCKFPDNFIPPHLNHHFYF
jgi:hypothetical protein